VYATVLEPAFVDHRHSVLAFCLSVLFELAGTFLLVRVVALLFAGVDPFLLVGADDVAAAGGVACSTVELATWNAAVEDDRVAAEKDVALERGDVALAE